MLRIHDSVTRGGLTSANAGLEYREIQAKTARRPFPRTPSAFMTSKSQFPPQSVNMKQPCKHPRVQIVSRDEDSEFVECKECGEIFESSEFKDMNIEESTREREV